MMNTIQVNHDGAVSTVRVRGRSKTRISRTNSGTIVIQNEEEGLTVGEVCCLYARLLAVAYVVCILILFATLSKDRMEHLIQKLQTDFDSFRQGFA